MSDYKENRKEKRSLGKELRGGGVGMGPKRKRHRRKLQRWGGNGVEDG